MFSFNLFFATVFVLSKTTYISKSLLLKNRGNQHLINELENIEHSIETSNTPLISLSPEDISDFSFVPRLWDKSRGLVPEIQMVFSTIFHEDVLAAIHREYFTFSSASNILVVKSKSYTYTFHSRNKFTYITINDQPFYLIKNNKIYIANSNQFFAELKTMGNIIELEQNGKSIAAFNQREKVEPAVPRLFKHIANDLSNKEKALLMVVSIYLMFTENLKFN